MGLNSSDSFKELLKCYHKDLRVSIKAIKNIRPSYYTQIHDFTCCLSLMLPITYKIYFLAS